jgi:hypothetical protein
MSLASLPDLRMETVALPREAFRGRTEMVPWRKAAGRVSRDDLPVSARHPRYRSR